MKLSCYHCNRTSEFAIDQLDGDLECPVCGRLFNADAAESQRTGRRGGGFFGSSLMSAFASGLFHGILLLLFGMIEWEVPHPDLALEIQMPTPPEEVEREETPADLAFQPVDIGSISSTQNGFTDLAEIQELGGDTGLSDIVDAADLQVNLGGDSIANVDLNTSGGSGKVVSFLGVSAEGRYMCIVADSSGSMDNATPGGKSRLSRLKKELGDTLDQMGRQKLCKIFFFESQAIPYKNGAWRNPGVDRSNMNSFISSVSPGGGTEPESALQQVFQASRRPDVLWLMTDGAFNNNQSVLSELRRLNNGNPKTTIHTISFYGQKSDEDDLRRIAEEHGGRFHAFP